MTDLSIVGDFTRAIRRLRGLSPWEPDVLANCRQLSQLTGLEWTPRVLREYTPSCFT